MTDTDKQEKKKKGGRMAIKLDTDIIENLAAIHCTNREIAEVMGVSVDTLQRNFPAFLTKGKAQGKVKLRRLQWQLASEGNATMQIWLGKNILKQKDQPFDPEDTQPLPWTD